MTESINGFSEILREYDFYGAVSGFKKVTGGNINTTYELTLSNGEKYILQKINEKVFPDVFALMENIRAVTEKAERVKREKSLDKMRVLNIKFTAKGESFVRTKEGCFRIFGYLPGAVGAPLVCNAERAKSAGEAFGRFDTAVNYGKPPRLKSVLRDFHNTPLRLSRLVQNFKKCPFSRKNEAFDVFSELVLKYAFVSETYEKKLQLPMRVIHGDVKFSNAAFDAFGNAIGVLDLDTVMYGCIADDLGDGLRSFSGPEREDERDIRSARFDEPRFRAFAEGFIYETRELLTEEEKAYLPFAAEMITLELSARFLCDYLEGDVYFHTDYAEQNLVRARCQTALAASLSECSRGIIKEIIRNI